MPACAEKKRPIAQPALPGKPYRNKPEGQNSDKSAAKYCLHNSKRNVYIMTVDMM